MIRMMASVQRPFLILTLRRTGGTTLTQFLSSISPFPTVEHEPFNVDRIWGSLTRAFRATGDEAALRQAIDERLASRPNIKHCFEIHPKNLTKILIESAAEKNYNFLLLTRRDEAARLRSLFLAQATGAWGPKQAAQIYPEIIEGKRLLAPISPNAVRTRAAEDAAKLGQVLCFLRYRRLAWEWVVYEEIYAPPNPETGDLVARARALAERLGMAVDPNDPRVRALAAAPRQNSIEIARYVPGFSEIEALLHDICVT